MKKNLNSILNIDKNNCFIKYIVKRVQKDDYRGLHISQHNRYDLKYVETITKTIFDINQNKFFEIPRGDYSDRAGATKKYSPNDYPIFKQIVQKVKKLEKRGTYNSIKKNFFVDFHRMGIIKRFDKDYKETDPYKRQIVHYAQLSDKAIKFLKSKSLFEKKRIFTDFIDTLFQGHLSNLADLIYNSDYKSSQISAFEFMFILSDINLSNNKKIKLLDCYNSLKKHQKDKIIELIKGYANPENFSGNKTDKKDFHNWINETQQLFSLMKQTSYFLVDTDNKYFMLNDGINGIYSEKVIKRSVSVKNKYFKIHQVEKTKDFELHHIIPISKARNKKEVEMLDNVNNLIYLHKNKHREITNNNNKNVYLCIDENKAVFLDFEKHSIVAKNNEDSLYAKKKKIISLMDKHNKEMISKIYEFNEKIDCI